MKLKIVYLIIRCVGVCLIFLLLCEILVYILARPIDNGFPLGFFENKNGVGYIASPNWHGRVFRISPHDISINSDGYRDEEWNIQEGVKKILLVGSTALFGLGVDKKDRLSERMEFYLGLRVQNAGMYGYGPPQALRVINNFCKKNSYSIIFYIHEYKHSRNDFLKDPARKVEKGELINITESESESKSKSIVSKEQEKLWFLERLEFLAIRDFLARNNLHPRQLYENWEGPLILGEEYYLKRYAATADESGFPPYNTDLVAKNIKSMQRSAIKCGAKFVAVLLPGPQENRFRRDEPASKRLMKILPEEILMADLRHALPQNNQLLLPGLDYYNPATLDEFAKILAKLTPEIIAKK